MPMGEHSLCVALYICFYMKISNKFTTVVMGGELDSSYPHLFQCAPIAAIC